MKKENEVEKTFLTYEEIVREYETRPKEVFLWNGVKEKSFGLIFGPSKSGKTIFCESLAIKIATGASEYLGYDLDRNPKKVLFVGLEEQWNNRVERNIKQVATLSDKEKLLINRNYLYQPISFSKKIIAKQDWKKLRDTVIASKAEVVFIDSITRMNHGSLEDSKTAEEIMLKLRELCYQLEVTLVCIHHTPKMNDRAITMDCIKGSSVFAQESDFAIGINRTSKGHRYVKNVFFRYAQDDDDVVKEIEINDSVFVDFISESEEDEILQRTDRRRSKEKMEKVMNFFKDNPDTTYPKKIAAQYISTLINVKGRMAEGYLSAGVKEKWLLNPKRGSYKFNSK